MTAEDEAWEREWNESIARIRADFPSGWSITGYKGHNTHDGVAWVATLRLDGKSVAFLEDSGVGGGVWSQFRDRADRELFDKAVADVLPDEKTEPEQMVFEALLQRSGK